MIIGLIGTMGKGKTLSSLFFSRLILQETSIDTLVSNFHIDFATINVKSPRELEDVSTRLKEQKKPAIYNIDEIWAWMDARESMQNNTMTDFVLNSRKRLGIVIYTTQDLSQPDLRLTNNTDYIGVCRHIDGIPGKSDKQEVYVFKRTELGDAELVKVFRFNPEPFYDLYDTQEEISSDSDEDKFQEIIDKYKEKVRDGEIVYKKELYSYINMKENISKNQSEEIVDFIFTELDQQGELPEKSEEYRGGLSSKQTSLGGD